MNKLLPLVFRSALVKNSSIYLLFSFLNASIPFLLLPFLTKFLSPSDYGIISMYQVSASFLLPFISINSDAAVYRVVFKKNVDSSSYIFTSLVVSLFLFVILESFVLLFSAPISSFLSIPNGWVAAIPLFCFLQVLPNILFALFQSKSKPVSYGVYTIFISLLNVGLTFLFIYCLSFKWQGRIISYVIAYFIASSIGLIYLIIKGEIDAHFSWKYVKHLFFFGGGLIFHIIGGFLITMTSRYVLTSNVGLAETGLYSVGWQVASIFSYFTLSFNNAFVPWLYSNLNKNDYSVKKKIVKLTYVYFGIIIIAFFVMNLALELIFHIFVNEQFYDSIHYSRWILLGALFQGFYFMVTNYISYSEKTYYQTIITIIVGGINILLTFVLVRSMGGIGAGVSYAIIFFFFFTLTWFFSNKVYSMPWFLSLRKKKNE